MVGNANYLFLGGLFPKETEKEIVQKSIGSVQNAANVFQWNVVRGFDQALGQPIKILNSLYIGSYPKRYRDIFVPTYEFRHAENASDMNIGFCNITGYKHFSRKKTLTKAVKKWLAQTKGKKYIFAYAMTSTMIGALCAAKKEDPDVVTCLIVPDLPMYMNMNKKSTLFRLMKKMDVKDQNAKLGDIDAFVFLTKQMNDKVGAKHFMVMEGIAGQSLGKRPQGERLTKTVLYTGGLNEKYGVKNLIDAFMKIDDPEYKLILCGYGDLVPYINAVKEKDTRIDYRGAVLHDEVLALQAQASVLVNPRQNTEEFTKYSFPSKNLEYLASGAPVIAYKLDGIPDEYDDYFAYVSDNSLDALANKIQEICSLSPSERDAMGQKARTFVLEEKNSKKQVERLLDFVHGLDRKTEAKEEEVVLQKK